MSDAPVFDRNRRLPGFEPDHVDEDDEDGEVVQLADFQGGNITMDESTGDLVIKTPDGGVIVQLDPVLNPEEDEDDDKWFRNLANKISDYEKGRIVDEVLRGIEADDDSRRNWLETRAEGIKMLGLELRQAQADVGSGTGPLEGMSTVRHPLLLEAICNFQAMASAELWPPNGPVKVRDDRPPEPTGVMETPDVGRGMGDNGGPPLFELDQPQDAMNIIAADQSGREDLAEALEKAFNHNLTVIDRGYRSDSVHMLFWVGFGGCAFKKIYDCPIKQRPVSRYVDAADIIVNNTVTDHRDAGRITHRIVMRPSLVRRMQVMGVYRDVDLSEPQFMPNAVEEAKAQSQGLTARPMRQEDQPHTIYESYVELDIEGFEHKLSGGNPSRIPMPWKVSIDKDSRELLELRRNWEEDDETHEALQVFVKYGFILADGFYNIGLLHLLGNGDRALTAAWRIALDAGMFKNFPGFIYNEGMIRNWTNQNRVPPGGGIGIKAPANVPLDNVIKALPYGDVSPGLITMIEQVEQRMMSLAQTGQLPVAEGRQDAPVGTTLALIEQATKVLAGVHINLHEAQSEEFQLLKDRYTDNPESFWRWKKNKRLKGQPKWEREMFLRALEDVELVPAADPNTASHTIRLIKAQAVKTVAMMRPDLYDMKKVDEWIFKMIGVSDPDQFFAPPPDPNQAMPPDPAVMAAMMTLQAKQQQIQAETQAKMAELFMKGKTAEAEHQMRLIELQAEHDQRMRQTQMDAQETALESADRAADRQSEERRLWIKLMGDNARTQAQGAQQAARDERSQQNQRANQEQQQRFQGLTQMRDHAHQQEQARQTQRHDIVTRGLEQFHSGGEAERGRQHDAEQDEIARTHEREQAERDRQHEAHLAAEAAKARRSEKKTPSK